MNDILKYELKILEQGRKNTFGIASQLSLDELNCIPEGFNNNIFWNIGHAVVCQHLMIYGLTGNEIVLPPAWTSLFKRGSKPEGAYSQELLLEIKEASLNSLADIQSDYSSGKFENYKPFQTMFGNLVSNIDEAIVFNNVHENIHLGIILSLRRAVNHNK
jgi:hypothetical protein